MKHPDGSDVLLKERHVPDTLLNFLIALEETQTTDEVWEAILVFANGFGLTCVDYVYASDFRNWERAQFIRTTYHSSWFEYLKQFPHLRKTSNFRTHAVHYLTPVVTGVEYLDEYGPLSEDRHRHAELSRQMGFSAGIAIPLRTGDPGHAATVAMGGLFTRAEFDAIWAEHGWAIHAGVLTAHVRYAAFFKAEFVKRNHLTEKHKELITLVGKGYLDKQIAHELGISFSAVRQRLITVQEKIGVQNRADLAAVTARIGLVPDPLINTHEDTLTVFLSTGDGKTGEERAPGWEESDPCRGNSCGA